MYGFPKNRADQTFVFVFLEPYSSPNSILRMAQLTKRKSLNYIIYSSENFESVQATSDFSRFSPCEIMRAIKSDPLLCRGISSLRCSNSSTAYILQEEDKSGDKKTSQKYRRIDKSCGAENNFDCSPRQGRYSKRQ